MNAVVRLTNIHSILSSRKGPMPRWQGWGLIGVVLILITYSCFVHLFLSKNPEILGRYTYRLPLWGWPVEDLAQFCDVKPVKMAIHDELYGCVDEQELPWHDDEPSRLVELQDRFSAHRLINAFRTTLPNPILQEEHNVGVAADYLAGSVILPGEIFSLNRAIGPRTQERGFGKGPVYLDGQIKATIGGGICKIASTLYNVVVFSDLLLVERHPHSMLVPYVPPGRDATVVWGAKDFRFRNNKKAPVIIWAFLQDNTLYIALYGQYEPPRVEWHHEELARNRTWTITRQNPALAHGEERVLEGADGVKIRTWVTVEYPHGPFKKLELGIDRYRPMPHLVEYGPQG